MVKMFFEGFVEYSGANLSAEVSGLSAKGIEIGFKNYLVDPKNAVSPFVQNVWSEFLQLVVAITTPFSCDTSYANYISP